jgi:tetratricopeptide (TPR) repeat protein
MGQFKKAKECADKLLNAHPKHPIVLGAKASALVGLGELEQAISIYHFLLENTPEQAGLHLLLGHAYKASGELDKAVKAYQQAYQCKADFGDAYWSLANTKTYTFDESELTAMTQQLTQDISADDKVHLNFALGKAYEDRAAYKKSFAYYSKGNALKQEQTQYQPAVFEQQVENHKRVFTPSLFERLADNGATDPDPIFIVGLPRAGSTLLEQILASHSQVDGTMELHNVLSLAARLKGQHNKYPEILEELNPEYLARFGKQYIEDTRVYRGKAPLFIDKMPNNFLHIGLIKLILPNAKIIACCFSGFKQLFAEGQEFSYGLENIGRYYAAYMDMMAHWNKVLPDFVLHVQHEDVIEDLETQVKRMLSFCGLEFEQACMDFHKTKRSIKTPSSEQVRQPIFKQGMEQHKHFEQDLESLRKIVAPYLS